MLRLFPLLHRLMKKISRREGLVFVCIAIGKLSVLDFDAEKDDRINIAGYGKWGKKKFS